MPTNRLVKNGIIARSGIYNYGKNELKNLGLDLKDAPEKKDVYKVYRPASVLIADANKFSNLPFCLLHEKKGVDPSNYKNKNIGFTGDKVIPIMDHKTGEIGLKAKIFIHDAAGINAYYDDIKELSPSYNAINIWEKGKTEKGEDYDIKMTKVIDNPDHLALVPKARGGENVKIMDSAKKISSNVWYFVKKKFKKLINDSGINSFQDCINDLITNRATYTPEMYQAKKQELNSYLVDLPDSEEKETLERVIQDLEMLSNMDDDESKEVGSILSSTFDDIDSKIMNEWGNNMAENATPVKPEEKPSSAPEVKPVEEKPAAAPVVKDEGSTMSAEQILTEIAKLISKMAPVKDADPEIKPEEKKPEEKKPEIKDGVEMKDKPEIKPTVQDSAYQIPLTSESNKTDAVSDFMKAFKKERK